MKTTEKSWLPGNRGNRTGRMSLPTLNSQKFTVIFIVTLLSVIAPTHSRAEETIISGQEIYSRQCASCHGEKGQGVNGKYESPLTGDLQIDELTDLITETMPEGNPAACQGEEAARVANYIRSSFYLESNNPTSNTVRRSLSRLTAEQLRQSIADLYGHFQGNSWTQDERGVAASYFAGSRWAKDKLQVERTDPVINFDFGRENPGSGVTKEEFLITWSGSLKVDQTGRYEIILRSSLSCTLKFGSNERVLVNNHVQSAGKEEFRRTLQLTGGRAYPFTLEFIQRKRKTEQPPAKVSLSWIPPLGVEEVIPQRHLIPNRLPATFSLQTKLPADDRSYGYERGTSINRQWDESTTRAALEFAEIAKTELYPKYRRSHKDIPDENREKLRSFLIEVLQTALRGPLSDEMATRYIDDQLAAAEDDGEAIKRSILISLKSPRFLYPTIDSDRGISQRRANRLALILYDSLPADPWLMKLISQDRISEHQDVSRVASKMIRDYRAQAKIKRFLYQWLDLGDVEEITKDTTLYPGFDAELVQQLRGSLDAMLDANLKTGGNLRKLLLTDRVMTSRALHDFYGESWKPQPAENKLDPKQEELEVTGQQEPKNPAATGDDSENPTSQPEVKVAGYLPEPACFSESVLNPEIHAGILSHPLILSHLAYFRSSSPIHRGVFLTRHTLGRILRPPSEAFTPINPDLHPSLTTRQRVELQTGETSCQVCHRKINSLGFALEAFDAVGRFRMKEKKQTIDASGRYQPREGDTVNFNGARKLAEYIANSPDCHTAFVESAFEYFVKQPINAYGNDQLDQLTEFFRSNEFNIEKLITEIACIASDPKLKQDKPNHLSASLTEQ
ncbi:MAG: DUF1588 domain-containing protein [Planctomycetota bacterium]|nr:DUF1588 domain-containing protein [Planctomycetota bacterium]